MKLEGRCGPGAFTHDSPGRSRRGGPNSLFSHNPPRFGCLRTIKASWDTELGAAQFDDLCERFAQASPAWIAQLRKKREHYLAFLKYPEAIRRTLSTTNTVEAVNGQLERMRRNNGGYFHSPDTLALKLALAISHLETGT